MRIIRLIKDIRSRFHESQTQFGKRFGVTATAVSFWEIGKREAPYKVIEFCLSRTIRPAYQTCKKCGGKGIIKIDETLGKCE